MRCLRALLLLTVAAAAQAQNADQYAVRVSAVASSVPARLSFAWVQDLSATGYEVYRRAGSGPGWGTVVASLPGTASTWVDSSVGVGQAFEYRFTKTAAGFTGYGYIHGGIELPAVESRGALLLIVDTTYATVLAPELRRLEADLVGDGWQVVRHDVSPAASVSAIKAQITSARQAIATINSVFLFGAIARPYSGLIAPDGHGDHLGAWPADVYYGDINGTWTDQSVNDTSASSALNDNVPGDGKFDQGTIPSDVELAVGRVDVAGMLMFVTIVPTMVTLNDLMRRYLDKDHAFRHGQVAMLRRGLIDDNFGAMSGEAFAASAWRDFSAMMGSTMAHPRDFFTTLDTATYLWSYGCGGGSNGGAGGVGSTSDFRNRLVNTIFAPLFGSYFGDWAPDNNFLRGPLFSRPAALASFWSGRPHWHVHHMGLGAALGYSTRLTQNNSSDYVANSGARGVHVALMGDPSLRMHPMAPPTGLAASAQGAGRVALTWSPSSDTALLGYHVYRAGSFSGVFTRVNSAVIPVANLIDTAAPAGNAVYMVRAYKLEHSGSGSYYNLSQGVFDSVTVPLSVAHGTPVRVLDAGATLSGRILRVRFAAPVESARSVTVLVQALSGRVVHRTTRHLVPGTATVSLDLSALPPGTYSVRAGERSSLADACRVTLW